MHLKIILLFLSFFISHDLLAAWTQREVSSDLSALIYTPQEDVSSSKALFIHLHGCAQSAQILKEHANWKRSADEKKFVVALPAAPRGGVYLGCWDYYGRDHTRDNRHNKTVLELVDNLLADKNLNIDPQKVFVTGLSSGAGQALVLACLAPEIFAGAGLVATPTVGSQVSEIARPKITAQESLNVCLELAANQRDLLKEQKISIVVAPNDTIVGKQHGLILKEIFQTILRTKSSLRTEMDSLPGANPQGTIEIFNDGQKEVMSFIEHANLGHNWPAGQGGGTVGFVFKDGLDYPAYLSSFLLNE